MSSGWDAGGKLSALWGRVGGRDKLAELTGIQATVLSSYNSGKRPLGIANARRIAEALNVTVEELGAPTTPSFTSSLPMLEVFLLMLREAQLTPGRREVAERFADEMERSAHHALQVVRELRDRLAEQENG